MTKICFKKKCPKRINIDYWGEDGISIVCNNCNHIHKVIPYDKKLKFIRLFSLIILLPSILIGGGYAFFQNYTIPTSLVKDSKNITFEGKYNCFSCEGICRSNSLKIYNLSKPNHKGEITFFWDLPREGKKGKGFLGKAEFINDHQYLTLIKENKDTFGLFEFYEVNGIEMLNHQSIKQCIFKKSSI